MTKVLVAYASKHHSTAEIAIAIGEVLKQFNHLEVDIRAIETVDYLTGYDVAVLGSAVYAGNWRPVATSFLSLHVEELAKIPVWLFSSGPTGKGSAQDLLQGWEFPASLRAAAFQIQPRDIAFFHGKLDVEMLNDLEKTTTKVTHKPVGDFR